MAPKTLYTIGYNGRTPENFLSALTAAGVTQLADVRDTARSRKPGFAKSALSDALSGAGISYVHLRALGAPKDVRVPFIAGGDYEQFRAGYLPHLEAQEDALDELGDLATTGKTAIMCMCEDAAACHRGLVAEAMAPRGFAARHL